MCEQTLTLGLDAGAYYDLGCAKRGAGYRREALVAFEEALRLYRTDGDRASDRLHTLPTRNDGERSALPTTDRHRLLASPLDTRTNQKERGVTGTPDVESAV